MQKTTRIVVLSLAAAGAVAAVMVNSVSNDAGPPLPVSNDFDANAATEQRIRALELAVSEERRARQLLEEELLAIYADLDGLRAGSNREPAGEAVPEPALASADAIREERSQGQVIDAREAARREAMVGTGLAPDRVDYILRRESEMRYEAMQAVFEARSTGEPVDRFSPGMNPEAMLRAEIGDSDFEKYLEAQGRPTSVGVASVMASSPGEQAGLQSGDEIVSYDGERVFSTYELTQHTMAGGEGNVIIDVVRDGAPIQIVVPRGPIGVEIGRFRGR